MKRRRTLGWDRKLFYIMTPGAPLAAFLIPVVTNGFRLTPWTQSRYWFWFAMLALGFLLGTVNLLLVLGNRQPRDIDAWHVLMAVTLLPSLVLLGFELFLLLGAAICSFFDVGPSPR